MSTPQQTGILMIHGFLGHPAEYQPLEDAFQQQGYQTHCLSLPGHGALQDASLSAIDIHDLLNHCQQGYDHFAKDLDQVFVVGHSLGGLCSLLLATSCPSKLCGVSALSSPLTVAHSILNPLGFLAYSPRTLMRSLRYWPEQITGLPKPRISKRRLWTDIRALRRQAYYLLKELPKELHHIQVPVLLGHSRYDLMVPYSEMSNIREALSPNIPVETLILESCGHQIFPRSGEVYNVTQRLLAFLDRHIITSSVHHYHSAQP